MISIKRNKGNIEVHLLMEKKINFLLNLIKKKKYLLANQNLMNLKILMKNKLKRKFNHKAKVKNLRVKVLNRLQINHLMIIIEEEIKEE